MQLAGGIECYQADCPPVVARGHTFTTQELSGALDGPVSALIRDDAGDDALENALLSVADTEFATESVKRVLSHERSPEDWRVGEAFAECHLCEHRGCMFPWPAGRDEKNPNSSLPGADLVGFQADNDGCRFAFGEVKTSHEERWPPQVMYGRHGLIRQLEGLRDSTPVRDHLVCYLTHRSHNTTWESQHKRAAARYLTNSHDVSLFGVLVRDVAPKAEDLSARAEALAKGCPRSTTIELTAFYLPEGSINGLGTRVKLTKEGQDARN